MNLSAVPVIYYHSVKYKKKSNWVHPHIIMTLEQFNRHIKLYKFFNAKSYFVDDIYKHNKGEQKLPLNSILIQFDDGYLDNYQFAYPLLKKHNLKATIWVNPDFVDNNDNRLRPTLEDYWNNNITLEELNEYDGFLNWAEMREMEKSGHIEIQSHTLTHTKYPISDRIVDFVNPKTKIDWLYWNLFPDDKPNFFTNQKYKIPLGYPIYESERANIARICQEDGTLTERLVDYVKSNGDEKFFESNDWKNKLIKFSNDYRQNQQVIYTKENEDEYHRRLKYELTESRKLIEVHLNKKVNHLCWPFGGRDENTIKTSEEVGYTTSTAKTGKNIFKSKYSRRVDRIALDHPKYQNSLFYFYAIYKLSRYKLREK